MSKRMLAALLALVGVLIATYLTLYKLGTIGEIVCSIGSCETVQTSKWATFIGLPVAAWGVGYYIVVLALAIAGTTERWEDSRILPLAFLLLTGWGTLFSLWLTYLELFVIHAICQWCVVSAILATTLFVVAYLDWREGRLVEVLD
ncbi:MAG TPA: vitamin K epoxide reductase family protein [Gemmatimonadaceae bacterium]|nr:vitamin K epoxide reductase family protein [Gemmatimonadaceae bacterium]